MPRPIDNPPNPWHSQHVEYLGEPPPAVLEVYEEEAKSLLSRNDSPDVGFTWSVNPYRGCFHGCAYCYARPSHQYLDFGAGTDFERRIVVKVNAPSLLRRELMHRTWRGEAIAFSGNTDCYQPLEASYSLTRQCLGVCAELRNPVMLITKGLLVRRDLDVLAQLAREAFAAVFVSIPFADDAVARALEPYAPSSTARFETLRRLAQAGIPCGVAVAPMIPGLGDEGVAQVVERAATAGARYAFMTMLRLPAEVKPVFVARLEEAFPERAARVLAAVREMRDGKLNDSRFGIRMGGAGPRWQAIRALFDAQCRRVGMNREPLAPPEPSPFRRPGTQLALW